MKKTWLFFLFLTVVLFLLSMTTAHAKPLASNYAQLKIGGYFPQSSDLNNFDAGGNFEVGIGHRVAPGFAIEGNFGYFETKGTFNLPGIGSVDETFKVMPLTLTLAAGKDGFDALYARVFTGEE